MSPQLLHYISSGLDHNYNIYCDIWKIYRSTVIFTDEILNVNYRRTLYRILSLIGSQWSWRRTGEIWSKWLYHSPPCTIGLHCVLRPMLAVRTLIMYSCPVMYCFAERQSCPAILRFLNLTLIEHYILLVGSTIKSLTVFGLSCIMVTLATNKVLRPKMD